MIEEPGIELTARPGANWSADGPLAQRALAYAHRFAQTFPPEVVRPQHLMIARAAPEHAGLGTGTQLGLAVARALAVAFGVPHLNGAELAQRTGRGRRSAIGLHGFMNGGFLVEGGRRTDAGLAPLVSRAVFPESWRLVVVVPPWGTGLHERAEEEAFRRLSGPPVCLETIDSLCRLVLLGMLPALEEQDLHAFGEALYDFNLRAGHAFAGIQGGPYASHQVADLVAFVQRDGIRGVGQSSWGPAVFAVAEDLPRAARLASRIGNQFCLRANEVWTTSACNHGAVVEVQSP